MITQQDPDDRDPSWAIVHRAAYDHDVADSLTLSDGRHVELSDRTAGGSKNHTRFGTLNDRHQVVVKVQANHGRLPGEEAALRYAAEFQLPTAEVVASGTTADGSYFLVLSRKPGIRPKSPDGWYRIGCDFARLAGASTARWPLSRIEPSTFADDHQHRLDAIASLIQPEHHVELVAAIDHIRRSRKFCLTHGDPGSGNYLDHPDGGTILDWETASVAPFGIDAGRGAFIALLDNTHTGIPGQLHDAFVRGYRDGLTNSGIDAGLDDDTCTRASSSPHCNSSTAGTPDHSEPTELHKRLSTPWPTI